MTLGSKLIRTDFSGFAAEPSVRVLWTPGQHQTVWAAVTRAVRTPSDIEATFEATGFLLANPLTMLRVTANREFRPETLLGYEAGYRRLLTRKLNLDVTAFRNNYARLLSTERQPALLEPSPAPARVVIPYVLGNGIYGSTSGFEVAPDWRPVARWRLNGSYSYLHMDLKARPGSTDVSTAQSTQGSSPHHQVVVQSSLDLPGSLEFSQTYRYVSGLPTQLVAAYGTADVRLSWHSRTPFEFSVVGQNLLQPHHAEYGGDPGVLVGIKRSVYAAIVWRR
jgi:iron complex outermembrane receptor protein